MKALLVAVIAVALPTIVHADPDVVARAAPVQPSRLALGGGVVLGGTNVNAGAGGIIEATYRLSDDVPLYARGRLAIGPNLDGGVAYQLVAGLEMRPCVLRGGLCAVAGLDVGGSSQSQTRDATATTYDDYGPQEGGHFGIDVGGDTRFRMLLDVYHHQNFGDLMELGFEYDPTTKRDNVGVDLSLGIAHRF